MPTNIPDAPLTREEQYLAAIANGGGTVPEVPLTRVEQYLNAILQGGGGGSQEPLVLTAVPNANIITGTVTGATAEEIRDAWLSGRPIRISLAAETLTLVQGSASEEYFDLSSYLLFGDNFCKAIFHVFDMTYELKMYTLTSA